MASSRRAGSGARRSTSIGIASRRAEPDWADDLTESAERGEPGQRGKPGRRVSATPADADSNAGTDPAETADPAAGPGPAAGAGQRADPEAVARLICLRQLTSAPRTRAQLADTLRKRGIPDRAAEAVLARFTEVGLIDDATFASAWVESRHYGRGLGRRALAAELRQRGVDRGDIQTAVGNLSQETELATARQLVARRLASTAGQPGEVRFRRLAGMLAWKGYPAGLVYQVVRDALAQEAEYSAGDGLEDELLSAEYEAERAEPAEPGTE